MRRLIVIVVVAVCVIISAEMMIRVMAPRLGPPPRWPTAEMDVKDAQMADGISVDVLFLGSSATSFGIDSSVVVRASRSIDSAYNAAVPFGSFEVQRFWYQSSVASQVTADLLVVELSPPVLLYRSKGRLVSDLLESRGYRRLVEARGVLDEAFLVQYAPYLRDPLGFVGRLIPARPGLIRPDGQSVGCSAYGYPPELRETVIEDFKASQSDPGFDPVRDAGLLIDALGSPQVVFLTTPTSEAYLATSSELRRAWEEELAAIKHVATERGIPILDSALLRWPDDLFLDPLHLNAAGAERLSEFVAAELDQMNGSVLRDLSARQYDGSDCSER